MTITKCVFYVSEAATLLNCAPYQIYRLIHTGQLPAYKNENGKAWHNPAHFQSVGAQRKILRDSGGDRCPL